MVIMRIGIFRHPWEESVGESNEIGLKFEKVCDIIGFLEVDICGVYGMLLNSVFASWS